MDFESLNCIIKRKRKKKKIAKKYKINVTGTILTLRIKNAQPYKYL